MAMAIARAALTWYATPRSRLKRPRSICAGTTVHAAVDTSHVAVRAGGTPQTRLRHHHPHAQPNRYGEQRVILLGAHWPENNAVLDQMCSTHWQQRKLQPKPLPQTGTLNPHVSQLRYRTEEYRAPVDGR